MKHTIPRQFPMIAAITIVMLAQATSCWAAPLIFATSITSPACGTVTVVLNGLTFSFYSDGLVYEFTNTVGQVLTFPGQPNNPNVFMLPPGTYTLVIKTLPNPPSLQSTSPSCPVPAVTACASCTVPPAGSVAWRPLDETTGNTSAEIINGITGTPPPTPTAGMVGGALHFGFASPTAQEVSIPADPKLDLGPGAFTIDAWIKPDFSGTIVSKFDETSNKGYELFLDPIVGSGSNPLPVGFTSNNRVVHFGGSCYVNTGGWTHITVTATANGGQRDLRCYLNGSLADTKTGFTLSNLTNSGDFRIGNGVSFGYNNRFGESVDELELFNRALSDAEANSIVAPGAGGKCKFAVNLPWDRPFCGAQNLLTVSVGVCNYSVAPKSYDLSLTGLAAGMGLGCSANGPSLFDQLSPLTPIPPTVCRVFL